MGGVLLLGNGVRNKIKQNSNRKVEKARIDKRMTMTDWSRLDGWMSSAFLYR